MLGHLRIGLVILLLGLAFGGLVMLGEGERQRVDNRRPTLAAKQPGERLAWRTSDPGDLQLVIAPPVGPLQAPSW
jgi:hypothetical protein